MAAARLDAFLAEVRDHRFARDEVGALTWSNPFTSERSAQRLVRRIRNQDGFEATYESADDGEGGSAFYVIAWRSQR